MRRLTAYVLLAVAIDFLVLGAVGVTFPVRIGTWEGPDIEEGEATHHVELARGHLADVVETYPDQTYSFLSVNLFVVATVLGIAGLVAFRDSLPPPKIGQCSCGYNLTGNLSGVCPECGMPVGGKVISPARRPAR